MAVFVPAMAAEVAETAMAVLVAALAAEAAQVAVKLVWIVKAGEWFAVGAAREVSVGFGVCELVYVNGWWWY